MLLAAVQNDRPYNRCCSPFWLVSLEHCSFHTIYDRMRTRTRCLQYFSSNESLRIIAADEIMHLPGFASNVFVCVLGALMRSAHFDCRRLVVAKWASFLCEHLCAIFSLHHSMAKISHYSKWFGFGSLVITCDTRLHLATFKFNTNLSNDVHDRNDKLLSKLNSHFVLIVRMS